MLVNENSAHFLRATCDEIEDTVATVLREENSDVVSKLKIRESSTAIHRQKRRCRHRGTGREINEERAERWTIITELITIAGWLCRAPAQADGRDHASCQRGGVIGRGS